MSNSRKTPVPFPTVGKSTPTTKKPKKTPVPLPSSSNTAAPSTKKPRRTPVPLPNSTRKNVSTPKILSQEFVVSSDDEDADPSTSQQKTPMNIAVHRPKTNGATTSAKAPPKKTKDSSNKAVTEAVVQKKPISKKVVVEEQGADSPSSSENSDDTETDIRQAQQRGAEKPISEKGDVSDSSSSDDSSNESEDAAVPASHSALERNLEPAQTQSHTVAFQVTRPYVPPKDFAPCSMDRAASSATTNIFKNLNGKQIWHITAPEGVSLRDLTEIAMDRAQNGEAVLSHKGTGYGLLPAEGAKGEQTVMIPSQSGYKTVATPILQSFQIQQVINLPKLSEKQADQNTGSEVAASITRSTIRAVRPQVQGLKMRFYPSGFETSEPATLGVSDDENEPNAAPTAGLAIPKGLDLRAKKEKRKHEHTNGDERMESPAKKHKHRTPEEQKRKEEKKAKKERKKEKDVAKGKA